MWLDPMADVTVHIVRKRKAVDTSDDEHDDAAAQGGSCKLLRASHDASVRSAASGPAAEDAARALAAGGEASDNVSLHSTESEIGPDFNDDSADSSPSGDWDLLQRPRRPEQQACGVPLPPGLEEHAAAEPDFAPRYYLGTKLPVDGWFQACRGCGERTSRTADVSGADIPMCPRCQTKFRSMQGGDYPPNATPGVEAYEPLYFWVPNLVPSLPKMTADGRKQFCSSLILQTDACWQARVPPQ